jgi:hypothetical protein
MIRYFPDFRHGTVIALMSVNFRGERLCKDAQDLSPCESWREFYVKTLSESGNGKKNIRGSV